MEQADFVYQKYRQIVEFRHGSRSTEGIFIALEDFQRRIGRTVKEVESMVTAARLSPNYRVVLTKAPGAFRKQRYLIDHERWVFLSMYKV